MKKVKYIILIIAVFIVDRISKALIMKNFTLGKSKMIIKNFFNLTYTHNDGAAFGMFGGKIIFIIIVSLLVLSYLLYEIFKHKKHYKIIDISASLIIGGLLGNLFDRIYYGYVVDFFDFKIFGWNFAIFNISDIAIVVGACLFVLGIFLEEKYESSNK